MKVRPIFWYGLIAALALALIVKTGENFNQMDQLNKQQQWSTAEIITSATPFDTSDFIAQLAIKSQDLQLTMQTFYFNEDATHSSAQLAIDGNYENLAVFLDWLTELPSIEKIEKFSLKQQENLASGENTMYMSLLVDVTVQ